MSEQAYHKWEATGVTGYPITHGIVGQSDFFHKFKSYLELVGHDDNKFAQVFAIVASWGVGKSRLGYEIIAQLNNASRGWKIREKDTLIDAHLFDSEADRQQYLGLYIRYSQVAHDQLNLDNWFAPAVYKALVPLAKGTFDKSIQHQIARQAHARLLPEGFDATELAAAMEIDQHDEDAIYEDTALATRLCNAAYDVLKKSGIKYVTVVLDELETAAERAGTPDADEARLMDGKAITMLRKAIEDFSKAVKEEDARARFPWLRFVALCSPAIGDELKEVQSTDRRFEITDLKANAFSDVSLFVQTLEQDGRLFRSYPAGLVEAAYMMSGGNFGWFNVIMAVVDQVLQKMPADVTPSISDVFQRALKVSNRIGRYVLDHRCLDELNLTGSVRDEAESLVFGQQPVLLTSIDDGMVSQLKDAVNAYGEPVTLLYQKFQWKRADCAKELIKNRFQRQKGTDDWVAPGIPDAINLENLLDDLATLAIHEPDGGDQDDFYTLLLPQSLPAFLQLLDLIHPHAAVEEVGRTLWTALIGEAELQESNATHVGPSVEMLRRLDTRLRKSSTGNVFRDPDENDAYDKAIEKQKLSEQDRAEYVLTGMMRLLDEDWAYDPEPAGLGDDVIAIRTAKGRDGGLRDCKALSIAAKGTAVFAWANSDEQLVEVLDGASELGRSEGRFPLVVLTTNYDLPARFETSNKPKYVAGREYAVMLHLNSGEQSALESIGLPSSQCENFRIRRDGFTQRFSERLNRLKTPAIATIKKWRHDISRRGCIAWPLRPNGTLKPDARELLVRGWKEAMLEKGGQKLGDVGSLTTVKISELLETIEILGLSPAARSKGYTEADRSGFWSGDGPDAVPGVPPFLIRLALNLFKRGEDSQFGDKQAKEQWLWGYVWDGNRTTEVFREWMATVCDLAWANSHSLGSNKYAYSLIPFSQFQGELNAAKNWLDKSYPVILKELTDVLGEGNFATKFAPKTGSRYQTAKARLKQAHDDLNSLATLEANPPDITDMAAAETWFVQVTKLRINITEAVHWVYHKERYEELKPNLDDHQLNLEDEKRPLWELIRHTDEFAKEVQKVSRRIRARVPTLRSEITEAVGDIPTFPRDLFVRPLAALLDIIDVGLEGGHPGSSTERAKHAKAGTLAHYLKELQVSNALAALDKLAAEVGVRRGTTSDLPFTEVSGDLCAGVRDLQDRYRRVYEGVSELQNRVATLKLALDNPPEDFHQPSDASLEKLVGIPEAIKGELEQSLQDTVEELLDDHVDELILGNFAPLMREARSQLLQSPEKSLATHSGRTRTLENAVSDYRHNLLKKPELLETRSAYNSLRRAKGKADVTGVELSNIIEDSLRDGLTHVLGKVALWNGEATDLLTGTDVSFEEWRGVLGQVQSKNTPGLSNAQMDKLVEAGFLRRIYDVVGGSQ